MVAQLTRHLPTWRKVNMWCAAASTVLWAVATYTDWVNSVRFISHISMVTMIFTFVAAWRADDNRDIERMLDQILEQLSVGVSTDRDSADPSTPRIPVE
jgi:hypothetical protein